MRVLFVTHPRLTIFHFMVPLAGALRSAGHEVCVAADPKFTSTVVQAGLPAVPVGGEDYWKPVWPSSSALDDGEVDPEETGWGKGMPEPFDAVENPAMRTVGHLRRGYRLQTEFWFKPFAAPMLPELVTFARHWQPDLVVWEQGAYAGPIVAAAVGAAHARLLWSIDVFAVTRALHLELRNGQQPGGPDDPLGSWLAAAAREYGAEFSEDLVTGQFTIDQLPESLRLESPVHPVSMRYTPYGGPAEVEQWLWRPPERARVALTMGLSAIERPDGFVVSVQDVLDALADLDLEVIAVVHRQEQRKLGTIPGNAKVISYAPLHQLAPTCAAVLHHAGIGTLATTTLAGVPQLSLPWEFDEPALAESLVKHGAGITVHPTEVTAEKIRDGLMNLIEQPSYPRGAQRLRAEMLAMPTPNDIVPRLAELTAAYRGACGANIEHSRGACGANIEHGRSG